MALSAIEAHLTKEESCTRTHSSTCSRRDREPRLKDFRALYETVGRKEHILKRIELSGAERLRLATQA